jgi:hypothetical protein
MKGTTRGESEKFAALKVPSGSDSSSLWQE